MNQPAIRGTHSILECGNFEAFSKKLKKTGETWMKRLVYLASVGTNESMTFSCESTSWLSKTQKGKAINELKRSSWPIDHPCYLTPSVFYRNGKYSNELNHLVIELRIPISQLSGGETVSLVSHGFLMRKHIAISSSKDTLLSSDVSAMARMYYSPDKLVFDEPESVSLIRLGCQERNSTTKTSLIMHMGWVEMSI